VESFLEKYGERQERGGRPTDTVIHEAERKENLVLFGGGKSWGGVN